MKAHIIILIITLSTKILVAGDFSENFLPLWERAARYTLEVVEAMPGGNFSYKATKETGSFASLSGHIVENIFWLNSQKIKNEENPIGKIEWETLSQAEILNNLMRAFKYVTSTIKSIKDEELKEEVEFGGETVNKERIFYLMRDHMTHHRAQLIVYLRLNKIKPPDYVGW
jgi:uncharacterized damage-inducible protein DinB